MPRTQAARRANAAWLTPNTTASSMAEKVKRKVLPAACKVSASSNTRHEPPASAACHATAKSGNTQQSKSSSKAATSSSFCPNPCAGAGRGGRKLLRSALRRLISA